VLGLSGLLIAAIAASYGIGALSGTSAALTVSMTLGLLALGVSLTAVAFRMTQPKRSEPVWLPVGASLFLVIVRVDL